MQQLKLIAIMLTLTAAGCVQKTYRKTVCYELSVADLEGVQQVGIRGGDKPLNWEEDHLLQEVVKDSLYRTTITYKTGYLFTQVKFVVNGQFELEGEDNRRVMFASGDTTVYRAVFGKNSTGRSTAAN